MARTPKISAEQQAMLEIRDEMDRAVDYLSHELGPAPGAAPVSEATVLKQWGQRDPRIADANGLKQHLLQAGLPKEMLDPNSPDALAIVRLHPEIAQMYSQPADDALADMLARLAEYPFRLSYLSQWEGDPETMVKEAERMDTRWQRSFDKQPAVPAPPVQPATARVVQNSPAPSVQPAVQPAPGVAPPAELGG